MAYPVTGLYIVGVESEFQRDYDEKFVVLEYPYLYNLYEPRYLDESIHPMNKIKGVTIREVIHPEDKFLDICLAFFPDFFKECKSMRDVMKEIGDTEVLDFEHNPSKKWADLREEARDISRRLVVRGNKAKKISPVGYGIPTTEYVEGFSSNGCVENRLADLEQFYQKVIEYMPEVILKCPSGSCDTFISENKDAHKSAVQDRHNYIFYFRKDSDIYSCRSDGFDTLEDFVEASKLGFTSNSGYRLLEEMKKKYQINSIVNVYEDAMQNGYINSEEYAKYYSFFGEIVNKRTHEKDYQETIAIGYRNIGDRRRGEGGGFENGRDFYEAKDESIDNVCEYKDYKILSAISEENKFFGIHNAHLLHILKRHKGGEALEFEDLASTLYHESYYFGNSWYHDKERPTVQSVMLMLSEEPFKSLGRISGTSFILHRKDVICLDGANIAYNHTSSNEGGRPWAKNIELVRSDLIERGFTNIITFVDNSVLVYFRDYNLLKEMIGKKVIQTTDSIPDGADKWLLEWAKDNDCYIVSGDRFRKYQSTYPNLIPSRIIDFQIQDSTVKFDKELEGIMDRETSEYDSLCHQRKE